jgi:hypothetical protein
MLNSICNRREENKDRVQVIAVGGCIPLHATKSFFPGQSCAPLTRMLGIEDHTALQISVSPLFKLKARPIEEGVYFETGISKQPINEMLRFVK